jgi:Spy/CpxP family protein refolding chaperone
MKKLILSAAFLGLGVFGFAQQSAPSKAEMMQKGAEKLQKMKQELNLTDTQVAQFKDLYAKKAAERKQDFDAKTGDRMQKMKENEAEVQKILTPDQFKKFQEMKAKKMAERKGNFQARKKADGAIVK